MNIKSLASCERVFTEQVADNIEKAKSDLAKDGYKTIAEHLSRPAALLKKDSSYIILNTKENAKESLPSIGIKTDNQEEILSEALKDKDIDVFDAGAIGSLKMNIPAIRTNDGQIIYLISESKADDFFAFDFERISEG